MLFNFKSNKNSILHIKIFLNSKLIFFYVDGKSIFDAIMDCEKIICYIG